MLFPAFALVILRKLNMIKNTAKNVLVCIVIHISIQLFIHGIHQITSNLVCVHNQVIDHTVSTSIKYTCVSYNLECNRG